MATVEVNHLYKTYSGKPAVKDLSFSVGPGEILGLIGPNGAGKSSTIKMILDFLKPDSGEVKVFGQEMNDVIHLWGANWPHSDICELPGSFGDWRILSFHKNIQDEYANAWQKTESPGGLSRSER